MAKWLIIDVNLYAALGAILACAALLMAWRTQGENLFKLTLAASCAFALAALISDSLYSGRRPFTAPTMALASLGTTTGLWGLIHGPSDRPCRLLYALATALGLAAFLSSPQTIWGETHRWGTLFGLAEAAYVLSAASLWHGLIATQAAQCSGLEAPTRPALKAALFLLALSLMLYGLGAQRAWGAYWSWEPLACWWLATGLVVAMAASASERWGWASRRARLALGVAAGFSLFVLLGALPLIQWLGLGSQH